MKFNWIKLVRNILVTAIIIIFGFYLFNWVSNNIYLYNDTNKYQTASTKAINSVDKKLLKNKVLIQAFDALQDPSLTPYFDKFDMKLKRQINVVLDQSIKYNIVEVFEFKDSNNLQQMYNAMVNKKSYKISIKNHKLIFINMSTKEGEKVQKIILDQLSKMGENYLR